MSHAHLLALLGVAAGAAAQSATGMGFSLVAGPALVLLHGPRHGVAVTVALAAVASAVPLLRDGRHARPADVARLLVPALLCTPLVALAVRGAGTRWLALAAGTGVVAGVVLLARGVPAGKRPAGRGGAVAAGAASALLNVVGGVGGPPIGLYAAAAGWEPARARGNLQGFFLVQNIATALTLGPVLPGIAEVATLGLGTAAGMLLAPRLPPGLARTAVLGVSLLGGLALAGGAM